MHRRLACVLLLCAHVAADVRRSGHDGPALPRPGAHYEDTWRIRIVTGKRDGVACPSLTRYDRLLAVADAMERDMTREKSSISSWSGRGDRRPRPARLLYGACDRVCVVKFNGDARRLQRAYVDRTKVYGEKVTVVRLGRHGGRTRGNALETDALPETVRATGTGRIDDRPLAGRELLLEPSDLTAYYSRGDVVFAAAIPPVHRDEFTAYGLTPVPGSRRLYAAYDRSAPPCPAPDGCDVTWFRGGAVMFVMTCHDGAVGFVLSNGTARDGRVTGPRRGVVPGTQRRRRRDRVAETVVPGPYDRKRSDAAVAETDGIARPDAETDGIARTDNVTGSRSRAKTNGTHGDDDVYAPRVNNSNHNRILFYTTWSVAFICVGMFVMDYAKKSIGRFRKTTAAESVDMDVFENNQLPGFSSQSNIDLISGDPTETIYSAYPYS